MGERVWLSRRGLGWFIRFRSALSNLYPRAISEFWPDEKIMQIAEQSQGLRLLVVEAKGGW